MSEPLILVVKHTPDPFRNEPRNVGVLISNGRRAVARFLGEDDTDRLNLNSVPKAVVHDRAAYRQWVAYFRECLEDPERYITKGPGGIIPVASPAHFSTLLDEHAKGQYFVAGGISMMESINDGNLDAALNHLFSRLVEEPEAEPDALSDVIERIIVRRRLDTAPTFARKVSAKGTAFHFDYGVLNAQGVPIHIYQRLSTYDRGIEKEVAAGAYKLTEAMKVGIGGRTAVIRCTAEHERSIKSHLNIIRSLAGDVINLESAEDQNRLFADVSVPAIEIKVA